MGTAVSVRRERCAVFTVGYLRVVGVVDLLGAVRVSFGNHIRRHDVDEYFTPYLLTAGCTPAFLALFLAVTMRRRKRAAWLLNLVLAGLYPLFLAAATAVPEFRGHPQNWVSLGITAAFCAALLTDWRRAALAQLRVPVGLRARGETGRRTGAADVAGAADLLLPVVADRVAVPRQRQVPARLTAFPALREGRRTPAHRSGERTRRGVPRRAQDALGPAVSGPGRERAGWSRGGPAAVPLNVR